jgi:hypothetical protein
LTIRHSGDEDESLDHLRNLFGILDAHPGGNIITLRLIDPDGTVTWMETNALSSRQLRGQLATTVRDRSLRLRNRHVHRASGR